MEIGIIFGVLIAFLAVMYGVGYHKGLIKIVLSLVITVVAFVLAMILTVPFETFIKNNTKIYDSVNHNMEEYVSIYVPEEMDIASNDIQKQTIQGLELPDTIKDKLIKDNTADIKLNMGTKTFSEYIAISLTDILVESLSVIVLFIVIRIILRIIVSIFDLVSMLPVINGINRSLGGIAGLVEGIIVIWFVCIVITACGSTETGEQILSVISSNNILSFIYDNNLILKFMKTI